MGWDMLGHEWAVQLLSEHVAHNQVRHAYLFTGPQGVGRRTLALRFTQALNCPQPTAPGEPCRTCRTCQQIERMAYPDLAVVQAEARGGTLKVDQIRELQRSLALKPYAANYRVALLLHFEEAHPSAANALLKTLEEPAPQVVLMLTAEDAELLLPTIVSRCEMLRLRPPAIETVQRELETHWDIPPEKAMLLAHISGGRPGYALQLFHEKSQLEQRERWLKDHQKILAANRVQRFAFAEMLHPREKDKEKIKEDLRNMCLVWSSLWRDIFMRATGAKIPVINTDQEETIDTLAAEFDPETAWCTFQLLERTLRLLETNVNTRLAIEVLLLDLPQNAVK